MRIRTVSVGALAFGAAVSAAPALAQTDPLPWPAERIAVFDDDRTLWAEQPMYFQLAFALEQVKALAPAALAQGEKAVVQVLLATHSGQTTEEFAKSVSDWAASSKHPRSLEAHPSLRQVERRPACALASSSFPG